MEFALVIFCVIYVFIHISQINELDERIDELEEKLTKLEKDAVKITFTEQPKYFPKKPERVIQTPKKEVVLGEYQIKNKHLIHPEVKKKPNPKQFDGVKSEVPFVKTRKRKPKTTKEWEDEFDLGGHE
jgi:hypothetical protein